MGHTVTHSSLHNEIFFSVVGEVARVESKYKGKERWVGLGYLMWNSQRLKSKIQREETLSSPSHRTPPQPFFFIMWNLPWKYTYKPRTPSSSLVSVNPQKACTRTTLSKQASNGTKEHMIRSFNGKQKLTLSCKSLCDLKYSQHEYFTDGF